MKFIKISLIKNMEQIINIDNIDQLVKSEDYREKKFFPVFTLVLKNYGPIQITEEVYNQITEKIKDLIL